MKLFHLADLHIGKRMHDYSLLEDQEYILTKIINAADEERPDAVIISGDVYDKSLPATEAVRLFDDFLYKLSVREIKTFVISGNHDSPERISFGSRIFSRSGVYMSPVYSGTTEPVTLSDEFGGVDFFMLPFVKPANVKRFYPDEEIITCTDAIRVAICKMKINENSRSVLITHQFVTGAEKCDSEEISVGGSDNVDASVFDKFDYVALGHIHRPQHVSRETVRYSGTPLKYSFSEILHIKSISVVELAEKGKCSITTLPLVPKRDLCEISGFYMDIMSKSFYEKLNLDDYFHIVLFDEEDIPEALGKLRAVYKKIMRFNYDNKRTRSNAHLSAVEGIDRKSPIELFSEFFAYQNGQPMSGRQRDFVSALIEKIWEDER